MKSPTNTPPQRPLVVRRMDFPFPGADRADRSENAKARGRELSPDGDVPSDESHDAYQDAHDGLDRHWFGGNPLWTHIINGLHFVFPGGERFFIRSVRHYRGQFDDILTERVRGFHGQEAEHQREHRRAFEAIEASGYEIQSFIDWYHELAYQKLEPRFPPSVRLATTVALEHFTALFGELALGTDLFDTAEPVMRDLLLWHAAEEIEHKSVAFDVFERVDGRYHVRAAGFFVAAALLALFWTAGTRHMLRQERRAGRPETSNGSAPEPERTEANSSRRTGRRRHTARTTLRFLMQHGPRLLSRALDFLRPGFHPDQHDNYDLAREHFQRIGRMDA